MIGVPPRLTFLSRTYCHLCDDMLAALEALRGDYAFTVETIDIDAEPVLLKLHDERVPVLLADGEELCHYFLDEEKVREYLARFR
ncbi:MAG: glutaredoxin family protein [Gammaproteobacteria bacterium]|nr:glutaredoxin family protein [Gammaproteobacteria bacterium]MBU1414808.1 glutaredoxin family protein [Gammaproteobacteria bacterium]